MLVLTPVYQPYLKEDILHSVYSNGFDKLKVALAGIPRTNKFAVPNANSLFRSLKFEAPG